MNDLPVDKVIKACASIIEAIEADRKKHLDEIVDRMMKQMIFRPKSRDEASKRAKSAHGRKTALMWGFQESECIRIGALAIALQEAGKSEIGLSVSEFDMISSHYRAQGTTSDADQD